MSSKESLEDLKDKIERIKSEKSRKEGESKAVLDRLKKEFGRDLQSSKNIYK